jgi:hypothetical protein
MLFGWELEGMLMEFTDKFIAFIDVLGFKNLIAATEAGTGMSLSELVDLLRNLGSPTERKKYSQTGPICCPDAMHIQRDLDFRITQISDCAVVSAEISPAGVINLIHHCSTAVLVLLSKGFMCRGYITRGSIYHTPEQVLGSGYTYAYISEKGVSAFKRKADEEGTPFVEVDAIVSEYVNNCGDSCVQEMFRRSVKSDGTAVALFPFQSLSHPFLLNWFEEGRERKENEKVRILLNSFKQGILTNIDTSNPDAVRKAEYYIRAIDEQLRVCDDLEHFINALVSP